LEEAMDLSRDRLILELEFHVFTPCKLTVTQSLCLIKHYTMKTYGEVEE
jgi:hypothetical protein